MTRLGKLWLAIGCTFSALAQNADFFSSKVQPLVTARCVMCHGGGARLSEFDLTTRATLLKGGKNGVDVVPGKADGSRLYQWVASGKMPPDRRLERADIEVIREWIDGGVQWGTAESVVATRPHAGLDWWALQAPHKPDVPQIAGATNPVDAFLLEKLHAKGLDFAPAADRQTLLRRLSFDLTGLPPGADEPRLTYDAQVEHVLDSSHYGERWGRHWLDIVRFGETDGGEHNIERFNAWRYRDYVIGAFNRDKPYNQFVLEQIAGDVLAPSDAAVSAATGFLTAGPWDSVSKSQNKDEILRKTIRLDELDDMVTTTFATFQALTVNCARCHDHKFDPIPTRDYYRLTAVFNGAGFGERQVATPEQREARAAAVAPVQTELRGLQQELAKIENPVRARLLLAKYQAFEQAREKESRRMPLNPIWNRNRFAAAASPHFRLAITGTAGRGSAKARIDELELLPAGRVVRNWEARSEATPDKPVYLEIDFDQPATVSEIRWSSDRLTGSPNGAIQIYQFESSADGEHWTTLCSSLDHINVLEIAIPQVTDRELASELPAETAARRHELIEKRDKAQAKLNAIPELDTVYGVVPETMMPERILQRGSLATPGEAVTAGTLSAIRTLESELQFDANNEGSRRLALARWITDPKNPLTARVIVNRVWQYHFGAGLVNTPSDFGFNGDRPSHPELLDYLAVSFMEHGWSMKWLHKLILSSRAYQQSAMFNEKAHAIDADNRLLWHMPLKRMDAETLRDSILLITGNLNLQSGGPSFFLQKKVDRASYMHQAVDYDGPEVWRRAVYRFVVRGGARIFMDSFDCPDPAVATPQRSTTNTAVQALTLLNDKFVFGQAGFLAERLKREAGAERAAQVSHAYMMLFGRLPNDKEQAAGLRFLEKQPLAIYCRALLNSNEFVYVP